MAKAEFVEHVLDLMSGLGEIRARAMFGGHGIFAGERMFALITRQGSLYLRADDENRPAFVERGLEQFARMPYYAAPPETLEDAELLCAWATASQNAAGRAKPAKKRSKKKTAKKKAAAKKTAAKKTAAKKKKSAAKKKTAAKKKSAKKKSAKKKSAKKTSAKKTSAKKTSAKKKSAKKTSAKKKSAKKTSAKKTSARA